MNGYFKGSLGYSNRQMYAADEYTLDSSQVGSHTKNVMSPVAFCSLWEWVMFGCRNLEGNPIWDTILIHSI